MGLSPYPIGGDNTAKTKPDDLIEFEDYPHRVLYEREKLRILFNIEINRITLLQQQLKEIHGVLVEDCPICKYYNEHMKEFNFRCKEPTSIFADPCPARDRCLEWIQIRNDIMDAWRATRKPLDRILSKAEKDLKKVKGLK